jgi:hypothetical protein
MRASDVRDLLGVVSGFDGRQVNEAAVTSWHSILNTYPLDDALRAVREHYASNETRVMPAHIRSRCQHLADIRANAERRALPAPAAPILTEVGRQARAQVLAHIRQVAGRMDREMVRTMTADATSPTDPDSEITAEVRDQWLARLAAAR